MKKLLTFFALSMHLFANAQTDPEFFPQNDRKVGYMGYYLKDGTNVVKPQFCSASYRIDGYYVVSKAKHQYDQDGRRKEEHIPNTEKFGLLNSKCQFIIDLNNNYETISIRKGIIYVIKNNLYGTINEKNQVVIPIVYETLDIEDRNIIRVEKNNKYGILNYLGKTIIPLNYDLIGVPMPDKKGTGFLVIVQINKKMGVINQNNQLMVPLTGLGLRDLYRTCIVATDGKKVGLLNYKLKTMLPFEFESIDVGEENIKATKNGYEYYFSLTGKLLKKEIISEGIKSIS